MIHDARPIYTAYTELVSLFFNLFFFFLFHSCISLDSYFKDKSLALICLHKQNLLAALFSRREDLVPVFCFLAVIVLSTLYLVSYTVYIILRPRKMTFHESLF